MLYLSFVYQMYLRTYQINKMQCKIECLQRNKLRITKKTSIMKTWVLPETVGGSSFNRGTVTL